MGPRPLREIPDPPWSRPNLHQPRTRFRAFEVQQSHKTGLNWCPSSRNADVTTINSLYNTSGSFKPILTFRVHHLFKSCQKTLRGTIFIQLPVCESSYFIEETIEEEFLQRMKTHFLRGSPTLFLDGLSEQVNILISTIMASICDVCKTAGDIFKTGKTRPTNSTARANSIGLLTAAYLGHEACVDMSIREGADVNVADEKFNYDFRAEINVKGKVDAKIKSLLSHENGCTPLIYAAENGHDNCLELLIKAGADVNRQKVGKTALSAAAENGENKCVDMLIEAGADVNPKKFIGETILMLAVEHEKCVESLIKAGANVNASCAGRNGTSITATYYAAEFGYDKSLRLLLEAGADVNGAFGNTASLLLGAVGNGNLECAGLLIEAGADVNKTDHQGITPLIGAAFQGSYECLEMVIDAGADVNINNVTVNRRNNYALDAGRSTIAFAVRSSNDSLRKIRLLLRCGARINLRGADGLNVLEFIIGLERADVRKYVFHTIANCRSHVPKDVLMLLFAAGETIDDTTVSVRLGPSIVQADVPEYLLEMEENLELKNLCRKAVRQHLIDLDPHAHLFNRIPKLGLPSLLNEYLLYECNIDDDDDNDDNSDDDSYGDSDEDDVNNG